MMKLTIKDSVKALSRGSEWRNARNRHIEQEPYCQACGRENQLEVHHVIPWHIDESLRVDPYNLITLCKPCHFRFGHYSYWKDHNPEVRETCNLLNVAEEVQARRYK